MVFQCRTSDSRYEVSEQDHIRFDKRTSRNTDPREYTLLPSKIFAR